MIKTRKVCKTCGIEKTLGEFGYYSRYCKECVAKIRTKELEAKRIVNKQKQELYKVMKEWHEGMQGRRKDGCNNDCDRCGFHQYCQRVIDVLNDTNWSEGEV